MRINCIAIVLLLFMSPLWASDLAREERLAAEIREALLVGYGILGSL